ncbi:FecR domain-containing protein [Arenimonas composti]|uniref:FecR protein domain-containing protein n=1 Tax=Arenimonas composti TR7-09 = DSM 18010 TaxID=1121013 RepID=A0A091BBL8_9GAMM|nr:FecR domain-containing protein [Arenimonas composti]KFN49146.1 hypothetical protein P873_11875 [Arenimonas composti TR7-09 = DSM 18010]
MSGERNDDYLWDRSGPVDPEVAALEDLLAAQAWQPRQRRRRRHWRLAVAAALALIAIGLPGWLHHRLQWPVGQPWRIAAVEGRVTVAGTPIAGAAVLAPGQVLETGHAASARLRVARIGELVLGEGSRLVLVETRDGRHRTRLEQGRLWARVWAPPGAFGVATPSMQVLDLGCEFVLQADPDGSGTLTVRSGWVQIDGGRHEVLVPEGARVEFDADGNPGLPWDLGADPRFVTALRTLVAQQGTTDDDSLQALLALARPQDAISLLQALQRYPALADGPLYDRLAGMMPAGAVVERDAVRKGWATALSPWWDALPYPRAKRWWLQWPDAFASGEEAATLLRDGKR